MFGLNRLFTGGTIWVLSHGHFWLLGMVAKLLTWQLQDFHMRGTGKCSRSCVSDTVQDWDPWKGHERFKILVRENNLIGSSASFVFLPRFVLVCGPPNYSLQHPQIQAGKACGFPNMLLELVPASMFDLSHQNLSRIWRRHDVKLLAWLHAHTFGYGSKSNH